MRDRHLPTLAPLTARSVAISALLGYHPPALPVSELVSVGALFGIAERTTRVALTRMAADGDVVVVADGVYRLTERLVRRQARQEESSSAPDVGAWDGRWEMAVVTADARPLAERVALRRSMAGLRLAELREGVWLRPHNLPRRPDDTVTGQCTFFVCDHPDPHGLTAALWDLPAWADEARRLHTALDGTDGLAAGFLLVAEVFRHLLVDPCLPSELLPPDWPGDELRVRHTAFRTEYARRLRDHVRGHHDPERAATGPGTGASGGPRPR